jgi:hypothetical protein
MDFCFTDLAVTTDKQGPLRLSELRMFTKSMSRHPSVSSLTYLSLMDFQTRLSDTDDQTYIRDIFCPLFALAGLTSVNMQIKVSSKLCNLWYTDAAVAWPLLETISISPPNSTGPLKAKITLAGLIPLVQHCTKLESVKLHLDAQPFDPTQVNDISNLKIRRLCLETYTRLSPRDVFLSLIKIFPNLEDVYQGSSFARGLWDEVNHMLHELAVHRRGPCIVVWSNVICTCSTKALTPRPSGVLFGCEQL